MLGLTVDEPRLPFLGKFLLDESHGAAADVGACQLLGNLLHGRFHAFHLGVVRDAPFDLVLAPPILAQPIVRQHVEEEFHWLRPRLVSKVVLGEARAVAVVLDEVLKDGARTGAGREALQVAMEGVTVVHLDVLRPERAVAQLLWQVGRRRPLVRVQAASILEEALSKELLADVRRCV